MMEIVSKTSISEVILLFNIIFILPMMALMLLRLRKYETLFGQLPEEDRKKKRKKGKQEPEPAQSAAPDPDAVPDDVYPYKTRMFLSPADRACLAALREALGEVEVYPKVALWELVEATEKAPGYAKRLRGLDFDFLVCDRGTGTPLTAVMYKPGKGRPAGDIDELQKIYGSAGANVVLIDMAEEYDAKTLKDALGIPDLDL